MFWSRFKIKWVTVTDIKTAKPKPNAILSIKIGSGIKENTHDMHPNKTSIKVPQNSAMQNWTFW